MKKNFLIAALVMMTCASCSLLNNDMDGFIPKTDTITPSVPGKPYETLTENTRVDGLDSWVCTTSLMVLAPTVDTAFVAHLDAASYMLNYGSIQEGVSANKISDKFLITNFSELCRVSLSNATDSIVWKDSLKSSSVILNLSDTSFTFTKGTWSVLRTEKEIGTENYPTINGKSYIALPIVVTMYYKYTATSEYIKGTDNQVSSLTHTLVLCTLDSIQGRRDTVLNEAYLFDATVVNSGMSSTLSSTINENSYDNVVMVYDDIQSRSSVREPMNLTVVARLAKPTCKTRPIGAPVSVSTHTTSLATTSDVVTANGFLKRTTSFAEHYTFDDGQSADFDCVYENLIKSDRPFMGYTEVTSVDLTNADITVDASGDVKMNPRVQLKKHDIDGTVSYDEKKMELVYVHEEEDYILYTFVESSVVPTSYNTFTATANFYEVWNREGRRLVKTKTALLTASLSAETGSDMVVDNVSFSTTGSGSTGTGSGTYSDNATNGTMRFTNRYSWSADGSVTLTYDTLSATFTADFVLTEGGQVIGDAANSADGRYTVYPYSNTVNAVYTVNGQSLNLSATAHRSLLVEKPIEDVVPGTILGVHLTYVPVRPGTLVGGSGTKVPAKCFSIDRILGGRVGKILVITDMSTVFPTATEIASGIVHEGDLHDYNSAVYMDAWVPGTAHDRTSGDWIWTSWTGYEAHIGAETVAKWGWGITSPICSEFSVIDNGDGTFVLKMNGASVIWK